MKKRVVITGMGVVSPIGQNIKEFWKNILEGKSGIIDVNYFDELSMDSLKGGEIRNYQSPDIEGKEFLGQTVQRALSAAFEAYNDANLNYLNINRDRIGVTMGTTGGEIQVIEDIVEEQKEEPYYIMNGANLNRFSPNKLSTQIAEELDLGGPVYVFPAACSGGNYAISVSCEMIQTGKADIMLAGGADAFSKMFMVGFNRVKAAAKEKCQPFDKNRGGMIVSEGAGVLVLEDLEHD
ncbi:MAG: hypothetical protein KAX49_06285 [Halanaerobiales bacterium]|nr:hypothetical protein [Halanaerobiales bacterium]